MDWQNDKCVMVIDESIHVSQLETHFPTKNVPQIEARFLSGTGQTPRKGQGKGQRAKKKPVTLGVTGFSLAQWEGFEVKKGCPKGYHPMPDNAAMYCKY